MSLPVALLWRPGKKAPWHTPAIPKTPGEINFVLQLNGHIHYHTMWEKIGCRWDCNKYCFTPKDSQLHLWTTFLKRKHHYPCPIRNNSVFRWWQSTAQNIVDLEIFHKRDWYLTHLVEKYFEISSWNGFEGNWLQLLYFLIEKYLVTIWYWWVCCWNK